MAGLIQSFKSIQTHMDYDGQARAEKLSRIIVTLFGVILLGVVAVSFAAPGYDHHKHVVIHVPYKVHTVHHHHVKKVPYPVHHVEKVHVPVHHVEKVHVPVPYPVVKKEYVPVIEKVHVPVHIPEHHEHHEHHIPEHHEESKWSFDDDKKGWWD